MNLVNGLKQITINKSSSIIAVYQGSESATESSAKEAMTAPFISLYL